jgi:phosphopantothenoylcysteine decarboxylase/phosphopantothenate--cysteine ligase
MLAHPAVQQNIRTLAARGVRFVDPGAGYLACGWIGKGRLAEPEEIVDAADRMLQGARSLQGRRVMVTAGPTFEDLDPVRFIGNRSSGRMGFAIAREALRRGAHVTLVAGPTSIDPPPDAELVRVRSAEQMHEAVMSRLEKADIVVMAAAVADYAPERAADRKQAKSEGGMTVTLVPTPDILSGIGAWRAARSSTRPVLVGFAAETDDAVIKGRKKLESKRADFVVVNNVLEPGAGFEVDTNVVTLVGPGWEEALPLQQKTSVAAAILDRAERLLIDASAGGAA